jgi:pimeloyl-ACP methyl ester carboxylesterase
MLGLFRRVLVGAGVVYAISLPFSFFIGAGMLAKPTRKHFSIDDLRNALPEGASLDFLTDSREVQVQVAEREHWNGTVVGGGGRGTVILLHPFGGNRCDVVEPAYALWQDGFDVILLDRRAHGRSDGDAQPLFGGEGAELAHVVDGIIQEGWTSTRSIGLFGMNDAGTSCLMAAALDDRIEAVAALNPSVNARDFVAASISDWSRLPTAFVVPQSFLALLGAGLVSGVDSSEFDARPVLSRLHVPTQILFDAARGAEHRARSVQAAAGGAAGLVALPDAVEGIDRWAGLVDFFRVNL